MADGLLDGVVAVEVRRDVLRVDGADATTFLQGQLSQDVAAVAEGASAWSWLLAPTGKVDALVRTTRLTGGSWLVDTDAGAGEAVARRLARFRLRTRADIAPVEGWTAAGLRGPGAEGTARRLADGTGLVVAGASWPGLPGADLLGPGAAELLAPGSAEAAGLGWEDGELLRIRAGVPAMGAELDERTTPAETGLVPVTVSFTKGCYTGQELVARIDSRGSHVPRRLVGLRAGAPLAPGTALARPDGGEGGVVTSVAARPDGTWAALGYARRAVADGDVLVTPDGTEVAVAELVRPWA